MAVTQRVTKLESIQEKMNEKYNLLNSTVEGINHTLKGNGSIGLYDQLKKIGVNQSDLNKEQMELRKDFRDMREEMKELRTKGNHRIAWLAGLIVVSPFYSNMDAIKALIAIVLK